MLYILKITKQSHIDLSFFVAILWLHFSIYLFANTQLIQLNKNYTIGEFLKRCSLCLQIPKYVQDASESKTC